ncbi:MAG: hypothetical protein WCK02_02085 [Bacteroidota bacterium]
MNLVFNELSFQPYIDNEHTLKIQFIDFLKIFEVAKKQYGFKHIVFPANIRELKVTANNKTFYEWVCAIAHQGDKNKILSVVKKPFTSEILAEKVDDLSKFYYVNKDVGIPETYCSGLATSFVLEFLCSSLSSNILWDENKIEFHKIINEEFETESVSVVNISKEIHFAADDVKHFVEYLGDVVLDITNTEPEKKSISLRNDHGKDKLLTFSKKVVNSKYVVSVINSLPFNPRAINLIKEVYSDGKIEMVLYWEDNGIGVIIQTTGKNYRETKAIADILKKEFD